MLGKKPRTRSAPGPLAAPTTSSPLCPLSRRRAGFGASHSDEMPLVFQQFGLPGRPQENASDRAMSEIITAYWTNFAKNGDPNGAGLPDWPAYSNASPHAMHFIADTAHAGPVVHEEGLKELDAYFEWRRTEESPASGVQEK